MLRVAAASEWVRSEEEGKSSYYMCVFKSQCTYVLIHECSVLQQQAGGMHYKVWGGVWGGYDQ